MTDRRHIETREVEDLHNPGVLEQPLQSGRAHRGRKRRCAARRRGNLNQHRAAGPVAKLHHAQTVTQGVQPHGLGVDRDLLLFQVVLKLVFGEIALRDLRGHVRGSLSHRVILL